MKDITRAVTVYTYTFGLPNVQTGKIDGMKVHKTGTRMGRKALDRMGNDMGGLLFLHETSEKQVMTMPIDEFINHASVVLEPADMLADDEAQENTTADENGENENGGYEE